VTRRIIVDLSNVTHVNSTGLGALLRVWTAAQNKECDLEIANLNPRVEKLVEITRLDTVFAVHLLSNESAQLPELP
jgi:anti-anti-sigma factor